MRNQDDHDRDQDREQDRDPVVAAALRTIAAPDHRPGFWADLDRRLDAEPMSAPPPAPVVALDDTVAEDVPLHPAFAARGRRRPDRMRWLAAAAVVSVTLAAAAVVATRPDEAPTVTADASSSTTAPPVSTSTPTTTGGPAIPPNPGTVYDPGTADPGPATPDAALVAWVDAVGAGDVDAAAALTGPRTRAYIDAIGGSLEGMLTEMGEGYGAWSASPDRSTTEVELGTVDGAEITVVVLSGTWTGEGGTEQRTDAIPVVRDGDRWTVEPVAFDPEAGGRLELHDPAPLSAGAASGMPPDGVIEVAAPGDGTYFFSLDDGAVVDNGGSGVWDPPGQMASQTHLLVAAYVDGSTITALATTFVVEG